MSIIWEVVGWSGAAALLLAYALLSVGRLRVGRRYHLINVAGSLGLGVNALVHGAWPGVMVNTVWLLIGVVTLIEATRRMDRSRGASALPAQGPTEED